MTHASANWSKEFGRGGLDASLYFVRTDEDTDGPGLVLPRRTLGWVDDKRGRFSDETWVAQLRGQYDLTAHWNSSLQFGFTQDQQKGGLDLDQAVFDHQPVIYAGLEKHSSFVTERG